MLKKQRCKCLAGIVVIATLVLGCSGNELGETGSKTTAAKPLAVNVFTIKRETKFTKSLTYFAKLSPSRQSRIRFRQTGTVSTVLKNVGDTADEGEILAELDLTELKSQQEELQQSITNFEQGIQNPPTSRTVPLNDLRGQLKRVEQELVLGTIVAPYDCIVSSINVNSGDIVSPQSLAFQVVENAPAIVEADLPMTIANNLSVGQSVWVTVESQALQATIKSKSPTVSTVGNKRLTLEITDGEENTTATSVGQTVKIEFLTEENAEGFWVPKSALIGKSDGLWAILVVEAPETEQETESSIVSQRLAKIVSMDRDLVFISAELSDGEAVIADGTHRIVPGQQVIATDKTSSLAESVGGNVQ